MNQIAQTFGQRVRYYRKKRGFSQEKLAELFELLEKAAALAQSL